MKNFRKVLALVLVIATLFSFAAIASADFAFLDDDAVEETDKVYYEDEASIDPVYVEGVRVLSYVGILNGYENGTFQASNKIRRNEMAKMIAVLANAGYDVEELYATAAEFTDVPADDWAASYVAYCAKTGIVAGRSATIFDPNASVTGLETAKMLLVVLGFDAEKQGYVGADWAVNVLRDAKVMGLLEGFKSGYNYNAAITREEAAHMMLNALKAPCVVGFLTDGSAIKVTNALVFGNEDITMPKDFAKVGNYATLKDAMDDNDWALYGDVLISDDVLGEVLFGLVANVGVDCFGRPAVQWLATDKRQVTLVGTYPFNPDFYSYNTDQDEVEEFLYDYYRAGSRDVNNDGFFGYDLVKFVDGEPETFRGQNAFQDLVDSMVDEDLGKGVVVEIYVREDIQTIFVVVINTYISRVDGINKARNTFSLEGVNGNFDNDYGFTSADVDETIVLFWCCADGLHDVEAIKPETATVTRANVDAHGNHSFVADGELYEYAKNFGLYLGGDEFGAMPDFDDDGNRDHDIYTDKFGYVMYTEWTDNTDSEIVVIDGDSWISKGAYDTADGIKFETNTVDFVYYEDGAPIKTVDVTYDFNQDVGYDDPDFPENDDILAWVNYIDEDEIEFVSADKANLASVDIYLRKGSVKLGELNGNDHDLLDYVATNNTQIIVRVPDYFGEEDDDFTYLYFDGIDEIDANYMANEFQYFRDNEVGLKGSADGRHFAYIYLDATYAVETNYAFVTKYFGSSVEMMENNRVMGGDIYEAIVNGEEALVVYERAKAQIDRMMQGKPLVITSDLVLVGYTLDVDGTEYPVWAQPGLSNDIAITDINAVDPSFMISGDVLTWLNGTADSWNGLKLDKDCAIWVATPAKKAGEWNVELVPADEFNDYREEYGWDWVTGRAWWVDAETEQYPSGNGLADYLLIVLDEA